jgi:hypothetical protein
LELLRRGFHPAQGEMPIMIRLRLALVGARQRDATGADRMSVAVAGSAPRRPLPSPSKERVE